MTASILQQLLSLYFAITYSWQLSSRKKKSSIYFKDFTDLDFFYTDIFFDFFLYAKRVLYSMQPTTSLARRHLNTMLLTNFEHFGHFPRNTQALTDPLIICVYLRTTNRNFHDQKNFRHPTLKLLIWDLVQTLNIFQNPSLRIFVAGKVSLAFLSNGIAL